MPANVRPEPLAEQMLASLRAAGLKLTAPRIALVHELAGDDTHPTAQALFERVRRRLPGVSFATVYNTLDALASAGLCASLTLAQGSARFDPNMAPHHHAVCDGCGTVSDVPRLPGELDPRAATHAVDAAAPGFAVRSVERIFRGLCAACAASSAPPRARRSPGATP